MTPEMKARITRLENAAKRAWSQYMNTTPGTDDAMKAAIRYDALNEARRIMTSVSG